jgi:RNA polymerase sigma-70 factor (ECF subfamily)
MEADLTRDRLAAAIARCALGDRAALATVYRATSAKLFGVCLRILNDRAEAEDVLQEVYLTVWRKAGGFEAARASPVTWLVAIARNRAIDRLRAKGPARRGEPIEAAAEVPDPTPSAAAVLEAADETRRLQGCLGALEPRHAAAIRTAFWDGITYDELARRMDVPLGTMKSWIRRGLAKLKECLDG